MLPIVVRKSCRLLFTIAVIAGLTAGCGGDFSPTGPGNPDLNNPTFGTQGTSAIWGELVDGGGGASASAAFGAVPGPSAMGGIQVSIQGTNISTTTNGNGQFLLNGVPNGSVVLHFSGGGTNATLTLVGVGNNQLIQITVQVQPGTATVVNQHVEELSSFSGDVASVDETASSFTLTDGTTVVVDDTTWWDSGGDIVSFAALLTAFGSSTPLSAEGRVFVTAEGALIATVVKVESEAVLDVEALTLRFDPDKWSLGWVDNGSSGRGNSAIQARISGGPFDSVLPSSIQLVGPDGTVEPFDWELEPGERFEAKFTKAQAISVATSVPAGETVDLTVRGTLFDGTPFELTAPVEIAPDDDDDDDDDDDGPNKVSPEVAAQAIADIQVAIDYLNDLVAAGTMAANNASPLVTQLESAIRSLEKLNGTPAINQLEAFLNSLDAAEKTGKISSEDADYLEELIEAVIELLEDD